jgi:hypothetical protein
MNAGPDWPTEQNACLAWSMPVMFLLVAEKGIHSGNTTKSASAAKESNCGIAETDQSSSLLALSCISAIFNAMIPSANR